jgi:hypothetical protein
MGLFRREKDLILKLTNLVLLLWLIGSITILYINVIDILLPRPLMTYDEYKISNCVYNVDQSEENCQSQYSTYKTYNKTDVYSKQKIILTSIGSVIIVTGALFALNKNSKKESK